MVAVNRKSPFLKQSILLSPQKPKKNDCEKDLEYAHLELFRIFQKVPF